MIITNLKVYDLKESVAASGYPMRTDLPEEVEILGVDADMPRAKTLASRPSYQGHDNFLSGIVVAFDLSCSIKMWTEFERYHFAQIVSSQSTMHRLSRLSLNKSAFSPYTDHAVIQRINNLQQKFNRTQSREDYLKLLYSCPTGLILTARITTNYRQLKTIYAQRHDHRLPEWKEFCKVISEDLPYFKDWCI